MSDDKSIDPRFDPAFQRGFDGAVATTRRRAPIGTPPVLPAQQSTRPVMAPPTTPEVAVVEAPAPKPLLAEEEGEEPSRGVNPFIVTLWIVAAALVLGGGYVLQWARSSFVSDGLTANVDYVTIEIVKVGAPLLVVLGLATAIGLTFLRAITWKKRPN